MDEKIRELYILFLKRNAYVVRFIEHKAYYEFEIEWEYQKIRNIHYMHPEMGEFVVRKLFAIPKIRR